MQEKRGIPRTTANSNVMALDVNSGRKLGRVANLSPEGMMLICPQPLENNRVFQLELELEAPLHGHSNLGCGVESLWHSKASESGRYWVGFRIIDISPEAADIIDALITIWTTVKEK